jgi:hypothetical protein
MCRLFYFPHSFSYAYYALFFNVRLASPAPFSAVDIAIVVSGDYHVPTASFSGKQTPERNKQQTGCASRLL